MHALITLAGTTHAMPVQISYRSWWPHLVTRIHSHLLNAGTRYIPTAFMQKSTQTSVPPYLSVLRTAKHSRLPATQTCRQRSG